jgi:hypothetical protein
MWQRARVWTAVAILLATQVLPAVSTRHLFADADAGWSAAGTGLTSPQLTPERSEATGDHCAVCHWMRAVSGTQAGSPLAGWILVTRPELASPPLPSRYALILVLDTPSRAPPARS